MQKMDIAQGTPSQGVSYSPIGMTSTSSTGKRGHSCCGACCDVRRAVVICDVLLALFGLFGMIFLDAVEGAMHSMDSTSPTTPDYNNDINDRDYISTNTFNWAILRLTVGVLVAGASIYGAIIYNKYLVGIKAIFLTVTMFHAGLLSVIINVSFLYPHVLLMYYIHTGIMSEETYDEEKQSCCCV
mmetsp:Transcript_22586/g.37362  ORF Transcript_22586/g.37362 Transcript_22586/m.37362 type:complete len:185 (+) Transcript_22586:151-705(+)|eukprot:CAMPEP_0119007684 /NCGR_PEP_ID=MMETSP1176-20130426/3178_1 /TAXON_ID=265551 /ORGANISM="Synedropsis recta cf, Strain CCMP1620" /LENGTH=184 /DNA_ID=CAMNT_0006959879 /DNA_START=113 /DNA_END=667 /DNA_ORIENTATION=-